MKTRVLLADDHPVVRQGVRSLLESTDRFEVVGEAHDGIEVCRMAGDLAPDILVIDIAMPRMGGIEAIAKVHAADPRIAIIVLSVHGERQYVFEALRVGALGYLLKDSAFVDLLAAIDAAAAGRRHLGQGVAEIALEELIGRARGEAQSGLEKLSRRECEVLKLIAESHTNDEIGKLLHISAHTVHTHRRRLMEKLGLRRSVDLVRFALRHRLTTFE